MAKNSLGSAMVRIVLGLVLGFWMYVWPGYFLVPGPIWCIPDEVRLEFSDRRLSWMDRE